MSSLRVTALFCLTSIILGLAYTDGTENEKNVADSPAVNIPLPRNYTETLTFLPTKILNNDKLTENFLFGKRPNLGYKISDDRVSMNRISGTIVLERTYHDFPPGSKISTIRKNNQKDGSAGKVSITKEGPGFKMN